MSEPNHLPKANHLRLSFVFISIIVIGLCVIGVQKVRQWKADKDLDAQRERQGAPVRGTGTAGETEPGTEQKSRLQKVVPRAARSLASTTNSLPQNTNPPIIDPPAEAVVTPVEPVAQPTVASGGGNIPQPGTIAGTVYLQGTPPPEREIDPLRNDPTCGKLHRQPVKTRFYVTGADHGLANVFVYIKEGLPKDRNYQMRGEPLLDQVGCVYQPYVLGVMVDQKIRIRNSDAVLHNVHATPINNTEFNFAQPVQGQVNEKSFSKPEVMVRFKCDVHPWMFAYVGVVDHPFFAVTDEAGRFELNDVPDGTYVIEAVHQKAGRQTATIIVRDQKVETAPVITLTVPQN